MTTSVEKPACINRILFFNKVACLRPAALLKRDPDTGVFP